MRKISFSCVLFVLCMLAIPFQAAADDYIRGDVNEDGNVSISDVTALIDYLLTDVWPEDQPQEPQNVTFVLNGIEINMVYVEGGTFTMGASGADLEAVMGDNPSVSGSNVLCPVEDVKWDDCKQFINKLNQMTGQNFRLPSEAEWEFAARGGNKSEGYMYSGSNAIKEVAWYSGNSSYQTHPVATKAPNELGLYDMSGNVYEICNDWYDNYYDAGGEIDPTGPSDGAVRVCRGGAWNYSAKDCRISNREMFAESWPKEYIGLRLAMSCEE